MRSNAGQYDDDAFPLPRSAGASKPADRAPSVHWHSRAGFQGWHAINPAVHLHGWVDRLHLSMIDARTAEENAAGHIFHAAVARGSCSESL